MASRGWGDETSCVRCGHPAGYHTTSECMVQAGSTVKKPCDCRGWRGRTIRRPTEEPT